jgi:hypothetical protein
VKAFHSESASADAEPEPTLSRRSFSTTQPDSSGEHKLETFPQPMISQPVIMPATPVVERELETIIIREKRILDETAHQNQSPNRLAPKSIAALADTMEDDGSHAKPIVVQSRIAPLIETGAEQLYLNRPSRQPQPTVHVTIGRIEVRAVQSSESLPKPSAAKPTMNLDDYLTRRGQWGTR